MGEGDINRMEEAEVDDGNGDFEMIGERTQKLDGRGAAVAAESSFDPGFGDGITDSSTRYPDGTSNVWGAISNYVNTIVGAGIVGLPFAIQEVR